MLDEWALLPRLAEFPVVVSPEQHAMSAEMVAALKEYVANGGKLLLTGAAALDEIPPVGPLTIIYRRRTTSPRIVRLAFEKSELSWPSSGLGRFWASGVTFCALGITLRAPCLAHPAQTKTT